MFALDNGKPSVCIRGWHGTIGETWAVKFVLKRLIIFHPRIEYNEFLKNSEFPPFVVCFFKFVVLIFKVKKCLPFSGRFNTQGETYGTLWLL
jgi:hypothetical protein